MKPYPLFFTMIGILAACGGPGAQPALEAMSTPSFAPTLTETSSSNDPNPSPPSGTILPHTNIPSTSETSSSSISFSKDVMPIFNASCNNCHGIEQVKEGLDMTSYDQLLAGSFNGPVILPGNSAESFLVQQVVSGEMPKRGDKLTDLQIQIIMNWIDDGALNN